MFKEKHLQIYFLFCVRPFQQYLRIYLIIAPYKNQCRYPLLRLKLIITSPEESGRYRCLNPGISVNELKVLSKQLTPYDDGGGYHQYVLTFQKVNVCLSHYIYVKIEIFVRNFKVTTLKVLFLHALRFSLKTMTKITKSSPTIKTQNSS